LAAAVTVQLLTIVCAHCAADGDTHPPTLGKFELVDGHEVRPKPFRYRGEMVVLEPLTTPDGMPLYPFICNRGHSRPCTLVNVIGTFKTFAADERSRIVHW
jgi:hypothetical protein